ncbi:uncharacterized protein LOC129770061 isoform X2 [Toxorhynchites rutilus septentrionalis]|uniref:uncharacterized protein LOC129770061 isoform X2 n=1 Tax=Toxorhynchites rutilus septentrionalis TaxID=329112 RepID=UPI002478CB52|nr:uncharacterized protein LOC129770061 isoform X2 [Toxorhynchites rutilus septentrionalis]
MPLKRKIYCLLKVGSVFRRYFFNIPGADVEEDKNNGIDPYEVAITKLDCYFAPQRHEAHERYLFWAMQPETDEGLEKFLMRVQVHASKCNFGMSATASSGIAVIDKMLQFVPPPLREKLLQDSNLNIEEMIKQVNAHETSRSASDQISGKNILQNTPKATETMQNIRGSCKYCGRSHGPDACPAWNKTCGNCHKKGHFRVVCFNRPARGPGNFVPSSYPASSSTFASTTGKNSLKRTHVQASPAAWYSSGRPAQNKIARYARKVHAIDDAEVDNEEVELVEMVSSVHDSEELVWANVGGALIEMQIDSGVQSNIIDDQTWDVMIRNGVHTIGGNQQPDRRFRAYTQKDCLFVTNMFDAEISICDGSKQLETVARFYVVKDGPQPLLGKNTAKQLGVLIVGLPSKQETVQHVDISRPFPSIRGVKIHIPVDMSVEPVAQRFRRLPFATLQRVDGKLKELLSKDIIERVVEPSRWVSPMVVVVKDSGDIRLCIDMRKVNKAILRETHPLPTIEDVRWKLNGALFFSRLDIKDAFYQLELDDGSKPLTTFITHKGNCD